MLYLSQMLGQPVFDEMGEKIGSISDLAIQTGEVFPRVTSLAFKGPGNVPFMISWRKYVGEYDGESVRLAVPATGIRFSYLQPQEVLLARDLMDRQIVDTQGMKVVRVNDLKLSESGTQLRLLGAEVGVRGILRGLARWVERATVAIAKVFGKKIDEQIIAWNYMDLLDRDLSKVQLSVTHTRLNELHPADVADILEQLDPAQRAAVFEHLDDERASDAISEMEDEFQADTIDDLDDARASKLLGDMEPDDAADIVRDLPYEKAERLLRLMGVEDAADIRKLLGYRDETAGGMMTTQVLVMNDDDTVSDAIDALRHLSDDWPSIHYLYVNDEYGKLAGVLSLRNLVLSQPGTLLRDIMFSEDLIKALPDDPEEEVAENISKYNLWALPVVDEREQLLGIVTFDDAFDVIEDDAEETKGDNFTRAALLSVIGIIVLIVYTFIVLQIAGYAG
ncbi:magnesium transporter [Curtanaerobium respiraculi]|uniref:magnesium transporter n=1 Tax=Curtanaerobium respiraculi TaxID=2949669 RepID=UPI0024B3A86E|nr:CBS domain-containing protein [Curtanaerobium respiraculi]